MTICLKTPVRTRSSDHQTSNCCVQKASSTPSSCGGLW